MKKARLLYPLVVIAIVLLAGVIVGSWALATRPTSHSLIPTPGTAGLSVQDNLYFGSSQIVYKLNGRDGSVLWKQSLTRSIPLDRRAASHFGIHVQEDVVYAFMDHDFFAFNANSGKEIWHQHIVPVGSLTTEDLRIYDEILDNGVIYLKHAHGTISARRASTGAELWHNYTIQGNFYLSHDGIYAKGYSQADGANALYAFDAATGRERWHFTEKAGEGSISAAPIIAADGVVYDAESCLYALNEQTGQLLWTHTLPHANQFFVSPQVQSGVLYVSTGGMFPLAARVFQSDTSDYFHLYAFNARTGSQLWVSPAGYTRVEWMPLGEQALIASRQKDRTATRTLSGIDPLSGKTLWTLSFPDICDAEGCYGPWADMVNHLLYVIGGGSHQLVEAFDVRTGKKLSEHALRFTLAAYNRGGVSNGTAYVLEGPSGSNRSMEALGKVQRTVEAFSLNNGTSLWQFKPSMLKGYQDAISSLVLAP